MKEIPSTVILGAVDNWHKSVDNRSIKGELMSKPIRFKETKEFISLRVSEKYSITLFRDVVDGKVDTRLYIGATQIRPENIIEFRAVIERATELLFIDDWWKEE